MLIKKNIKQQKMQMRSICKKYRNNLDKATKLKLDEKLQDSFINFDYFKTANTIFAFVSKDIEIDTSKIINIALKENKKIAVPKCRTEETQMDFYYINSVSDLEKGFYGLLEPNTTNCEKVCDYSNGVCLVPGLCFDKYGYRLGFGKGYYDRFLLDFFGLTISLCYSKCVESEVPRGYYDRPVDILITEKYTIDTRSNQ